MPPVGVAKADIICIMSIAMGPPAITTGPSGKTDYCCIMKGKSLTSHPEKPMEDLQHVRSPRLLDDGDLIHVRRRGGNPPPSLPLGSRPPLARRLIIDRTNDTVTNVLKPHVRQQIVFFLVVWMRWGSRSSSPPSLSERRLCESGSVPC